MTLLFTEKIDSVDLRLQQSNWGFSERHRAEIAARWNRRVLDNPSLWNGRVLISHDVRIVNGCLSAVMRETDYASFVVWRDMDWPDKETFNIFGMGVVISSDGVLVFGEMAQNTVNPGRIYPPGGSLEPRDADADGRVDIDRSVQHEILEEIGLDVSGDRRGDRFAVFEGQRIAVVQSYFHDLSFAEIDAQFSSHQQTQNLPELVRLVPLRKKSDLTEAMPDWAKASALLFLRD
jgi:8-oxo-dGTP pyrophosphatase MutT (NUDIX family)